MDMHKNAKRVALAGLTAVTILSLSPVTAADAAERNTAKVAASATCPWPYVCFFDRDGNISGKFRDVTRDWQWLTRSKGAPYARNARNDDTVWYHFTDGTTRCAEAQMTSAFPGQTVDAVRISYDEFCPPGSTGH
jgi:hypothetical protein